MALHPKIIDLSLDRMERILAALDHPEAKLPPVVHVAGTNGKGSVIAFLRAMLEAEGKAVHVYTSPHLVRFHERIRLAGELISEPDLLALLEVCEEANGGLPGLRPPAGRHAAAGSGTGRAARRDQHDRPAGAHRHHAGFHGPHAVPGRQTVGHRRGEGGHPQTRRSRHHRAPGRRGHGGDPRAGAGNRGAPHRGRSGGWRGLPRAQPARPPSAAERGHRDHRGKAAWRACNAWKEGRR